MKLASDIEMVILRGIWNDFPHMPKICPNCLAFRSDVEVCKPHATWCGKWRDILAAEKNASEYLICI
jgi:hypothetical protein